MEEPLTVELGGTSSIHMITSAEAPMGRHLELEDVQIDQELHCEERKKT
jgi:hypothetical protein